MYALVPKIKAQIVMVIKSRATVLLIFKISAITDDIKGNERPRPTPAPHKIAPMNNTSKIKLINLFLKKRIPEKVKLDSGFKLKANPKATTGKQYIAHAVKPQ
tara:strand:- start:272 stop:580 length:309 start_codon:yes stop_codon:yes gene_type:complete